MHFLPCCRSLSWVASAISHMVWVTSWDTTIFLSYLGFVLRQNLGHVHTDWLPGAPSKVLPPSCHHFPSLFHEKENLYWQGRQALCRGASFLSSCRPPAFLSQRHSGTEKNRSACCLLLLCPFHTGTQSNRKKDLQKRAKFTFWYSLFHPGLPIPLLRDLRCCSLA